jgi:hypothetical protein
MLVHFYNFVNIQHLFSEHTTRVCAEAAGNWGSFPEEAECAQSEDEKEDDLAAAFIRG